VICTTVKKAKGIEIMYIQKGQYILVEGLTMGIDGLCGQTFVGAS
jgi:hypothetical protein